MGKTIDPAEADIDELRVFAAAVAEQTVDLSRMDPTARADLILLHREFADMRDQMTSARSPIPGSGDLEHMEVVNLLVAEGKIRPHWARWARPSTEKRRGSRRGDVDKLLAHFGDRGFEALSLHRRVWYEPPARGIGRSTARSTIPALAVTLGARRRDEQRKADLLANAGLICC